MAVYSRAAAFNIRAGIEAFDRWVSLHDENHAKAVAERTTKPYVTIAVMLAVVTALEADGYVVKKND